MPAIPAPAIASIDMARVWMERVNNCGNCTPLICCGNDPVECHHVFWVTQASAPSWIKASGLTTDEQGFILVTDTFGLSCNGLVHPEQLLRKSGMKPGQVLILTKAIGTGTLFAANMRYQAKGRWIEQAVESMLLSNQTAAQVFRECGATACTNITGFGVLGHLR
ncbi:hypothetical protein [Moorena sp. SIO3I8]